MSSADDGADEVKVFRRSDADDVDGGQSSAQLTEDKKDVALETELESRSTSNPIDMMAGARKGFQWNPALNPFQSPMSPSCMPFMMPNLGAGFLMSPNYNPYLIQQALSPSVNMFRNMAAMSQGSPFYQNPMIAKQYAANMMRSMEGQMNPLNMRFQSNNMMPSSSNESGNSYGNTPKRMKTEEEKKQLKEHVKKPLNAFMWYMKENRPKLLEEAEYKEKQSAELNKELGRRWHDLPKEEQQKYYDLAKQDREDHQQKYPNWTARDNYAIRKRKKAKREKSMDGAENKKCRARFGIQNQESWCKHCKRKKRCLWYREKGEGAAPSPALSSSNGMSSSRTPVLSSPASSGVMGSIDENDHGNQSDNDVDLNRTTVLQDLNQTPTSANFIKTDNLTMPPNPMALNPHMNMNMNMTMMNPMMLASPNFMNPWMAARMIPDNQLL